MLARSFRLSNRGMSCIPAFLVKNHQSMNRYSQVWVFPRVDSFSSHWSDIMTLLVFSRSSNSMRFAATSREISLIVHLRTRTSSIRCVFAFVTTDSTLDRRASRWSRRTSRRLIIDESDDPGISDLQNLVSWISSKTVLRHRRWIPRFGRQHRENSLLEPIFWRAHEFSRIRPGWHRAW